MSGGFVVFQVGSGSVVWHEWDIERHRSIGRRGGDRSVYEPVVRKVHTANAELKSQRGVGRYSITTAAASEDIHKQFTHDVRSCRDLCIRLEGNTETRGTYLTCVGSVWSCPT